MTPLKLIPSMVNPESLSGVTSSDFEKEAIARFRAMVSVIPKECHIFREPWEFSTILCLDFEACPNLLPKTQAQVNYMLIAAQDMAFAKCIIFRIGNKVMGWKSLERV